MHITPHLHVVKDSWKSKKLKNILNFKFLKSHIFEIVSVFWSWVVGCYHLKKNYHQNYVITIVFYLVFCKINHI
jgi:hypothetical protein